MSLSQQFGGKSGYSGGGVSLDIMRPPSSNTEGYNRNAGGTALPYEKGLMPTFQEAAVQDYSAIMVEPQAQSEYEPIFEDPEPERTVLQDMFEGENVDFGTPDVDPNALMIDPNLPAPEAANMVEKAVNCMDEVQDKMEMISETWDAHQEVATEYLKEAATNLGHDPDHVASQFRPQDSASKAGAAAGVAAQAATGSGSLALQFAGNVGQGATIAESINEQRKDLTREQKKALIEEVCKIAQSKAPEGAKPSTSGGKPSNDPEDIARRLANLSAAKMEKLLTQDVTQQPEFQALAQKEFEMEVVKDNHMYFAEHNGDKITSAKVLQVESTDNHATLTQQVNRATVACDAIEIAGHAISASSLKAPGGLSFSSPTIAMISDSERLGSDKAATLDMSRMNMAVVANELNSFAKQATMKWHS